MTFSDTATTGRAGRAWMAAGLRRVLLQSDVTVPSIVIVAALLALAALNTANWDTQRGIASWCLVVMVMGTLLLLARRLLRSLETLRGALAVSLSLTAARANIASALNDPQPLDQALRAVCAEVCRATACSTALVVVTVAELGDAYCVGHGAIRCDDTAPLIEGEGPMAALLRHPRPGGLDVHLTPNDPARRFGERLIATPLRLGERVLGVLAAFDVPEGEAVERLFWASVAEQIALALERYRILAVMQRQATIDDLTGLHNHRFFADNLGQQVALAERLSTPLSLLMIDIDHFKELNDTMGHYAGDQALVAFADVVRSNIRRSDLAARYGGEEFVVVMPNTNRREASLVAEKLRRALQRRRIEVSPQLPPVTITASVGVAAYPQDTADAKQLLRLADEALYCAKNQGRNRVCRASDLGPGNQIMGTAIRTANRRHL